MGRRASISYVNGMRYQRAELPLKLDGIEAARTFFAGCLAEEDSRRESLWVAHLDDQAHCLHLTRHCGDDEQTLFPIRQIVADAAIHASAGIVLAHNHPSGDARPSDSDCRRSTRLHARRSSHLRRRRLHEFAAHGATLALRRRFR